MLNKKLLLRQVTDERVYQLLKHIVKMLATGDTNRRNVDKINDDSTQKK